MLSLTGTTDNGVITLNGTAPNATVEANLKFDGTTLTVTGNATISGDLTVSGTTTYINTTTLNVGDNIITLNADIGAATAPTENAGIEVKRGNASTVSFYWNESTDRWYADNTLEVGGNVVLSGTIDTGQGATEVYLMNQNVRTSDSPSFNRITSTVATGTSPLVVTSTTVVTNLNADLWDGYQFSDYLNQAVRTTDNVTHNKLRVTAAGNSAGGNILMGPAGEGSNKWSYLTATHYNATSQAQGVSLIGAFTTAAANTIAIGGSIYEANPATPYRERGRPLGSPSSRHFLPRPPQRRCPRRGGGVASRTMMRPLPLRLLQQDSTFAMQRVRARDPEA